MIKIIFEYIGLGFTHVIPLGFDHILFMLSLFLLASNLKMILWQCSLFTAAHSLSLGIAATGFFEPDPKIIEPLIAITILYTAVDNILNQKESKFRMLLIFFFGLIHGFGFANALAKVGLEEKNFLVSLLSFNIGVEIGQILIVITAYFLISKPFADKKWYRNRIVHPISTAIGCIALYWTIERIIL